MKHNHKRQRRRPEGGPETHSGHAAAKTYLSPSEIARLPKRPERMTLHDLLVEARGQATFAGLKADAEARKPVSFSAVLRGEVNLLDD